MKRLLPIIFLLAGFLPFASGQNLLPRPNPPMLVNDEAHVLSDYDRNTLEQRLVALDDSTSNQIAIVTIPTLNDYPIEDYANKLLRSWGIGTKKNNNGVLILVAVNDHKVWIEVGYGLEGAIPDVTAKDIISNDITPAFKKGNYYSGLSAAAEDLGQAAAGEYHVKRQTDDDGGGGGWIGFVIIVVVIIIVIASRSGRGGGGMMRRSGASWLIWPLLFGGFGDGGGRSSGGGSWGSAGGGGFGGFGGGSSGGGGAGGSW